MHMQHAHLTHTSQVHNIDSQLLTSVSTFLYLQHRCQPHLPTPSLPDTRDPPVKSCDPTIATLDVYPGSLFESSRAIMLTLTAFSEGEHSFPRQYVVLLW